MLLVTNMNLLLVVQTRFMELLFEDKSVLWSEVLRRRRTSSSEDRTLSMGVKKEITIGDVFGDKYTLYSNSGVFAPDEKKGWLVKGIERYNE